MTEKIKLCKKCNLHLSVDKFSANKKNKDGLYSYCKPCAKENRKKYGYESVPYNPEMKKFYRLLNRYGISRERYLFMVLAQNNKCSLCDFEFSPGRMTSPVVDHDHSCCPGRKTCGNCIRGLICWECNITIGWLEKVSNRTDNYYKKIQKHLNL